MIVILLFIISSIFSKDLKCKVDFLNAYNIEGENNARF